MMKQMIDNIKNSFMNREFLVFLIIGVFNTFNGSVLAYVYSLVLKNANLSFIIGYLTSLVIAYFLNTFFAFRQKPAFAKMIRFMISYIPNFIIQNIIVLIVYNTLHWHQMIAYVLAAAIGVPVTFLLLKVFAFGKKGEKRMQHNDSNNRPKSLVDVFYRLISFFQGHRKLFLFAVIIGYVVLQSIAHWSLVLNENVMKWDIWEAYYPAGLLMSDALHGGTIPMWNPLMLFGVPYYTIVGMPIWYPTTLLFSWLGYTPALVNIEYVLHTVIAGFGAFLFIDRSINKGCQHITVRTAMAFLAGFLYANCGLFISNAQHIMIIVSASWMPYVLYYYQSYLENHRTKHLMLTAVFCALMFYGGYPELFYCLFVFLVPFTLYFNTKKKQGVGKYILDSAWKYIKCGLCTVAASAALMLPFLLSISSLARANGAGMVPTDMNPASLLTSFLPGIANIIPGEISMGIYYVGLFSIVILPTFFKSKYKDKKFYFITTIVLLIINLGDGNFLHSLLYRFAPMYSVFRFPTITRCFLALFLLLMSAHFWSELIEKGPQKTEGVQLSQKWCKILLGACIGLFVLSFVLYDVVGIAEDALNTLMTGTFYGGMIYFLYAMLLKEIVVGKLSKKLVCIALAAVVCFEGFSFVYMYTPVTIANYSPVQASQYDSVQKDIESSQDAAIDHYQSIDFSQSVRTYSGTDSLSIVFNKTLDERGYLSFILSGTKQYLDSYNNMITDENPVAYFTSNVVNESVVDLEDWLEDPAVTPDQIYVENGILPTQEVEPSSAAEPTVVSVQKPNVIQEDGAWLIQHEVPALKGSRYYKIRVYLNKTDAKKVTTQLLFNDAIEAEGDFHLMQEDGKSYIDVYYPDPKTNYTSVRISMENEQIEDVEILEMERTTASKHVTIDAFSFNHIELTVDAPENGYLTLMQTKYPGWNVYVDGEQTETATVDGNFMGVWLEKGTHHLIFKFRPTEFFVGIGITALFGVAFVIVLVLDFRKTKTRRKSAVCR